MKPVQSDLHKLERFRPAFNVALYKTQVDVAGNHLSGLLLIKRMPDTTLRMVFSNEMGFTFFDFEFGKNGSFRVYSVISQMNRKAVLKTLQHDLELLLMQDMDFSNASVRENDGQLYHVFPKGNGFHYYITDSTAGKLLRLERASRKKVVAQTIMMNYVDGIPDTIGISHTAFEFNIGLKRIER